MEKGKAAEMLLGSIPHGRAIDTEVLVDVYTEALNKHPERTAELDEAFETLWEFKGTFPPKQEKRPIIGARIHTPTPEQKAKLDAAHKKVSKEWNAHIAKTKTSEPKTKTETKTSEKKSGDFPTGLVEALNDMVGVDPKVCGTWIWLHGSTEQHATELKALGCKFGKKKQLWYWSPPGSSKRRRKGGMSYEWIKNKHGEKDLEVAA